MSIEELEKLAYSFIPKVVIIVGMVRDENETKLQGSSAEKTIIDLSDKLSTSPVIIKQYFTDLSEKKIFILINESKYGFSSDGIYKEFYKYVYEVLSHKNLYEKVSAEYLKEKLILWIVEGHISGRVNENLFSYIFRNIDRDVQNYSFYFPILNIEIDKEFNVGKSKITFFTKQFLKEIYQIEFLEKLGENEFEETFMKFSGKVLVSVDVFAEKKLANDLAFKYASYIVDILKLTSPTVTIPFEKCYLELESKIPFSYEYLSFKNNDFAKFTYHVGVNRENQLNYTSEMIDSWSNFFKQFGNLFHKDDEKSKLIKNSIIFYSKCLSEEDIHLRVSKLVMIIEGIFLKLDEKYRMESKSKRRFLYFRFHNDSQQKKEFSGILDRMYDVRHKMTHKSIRLYIDNMELREFQQEIIHVLYMLSKTAFIDFEKESFLTALDEGMTI